MKCFIGEVLSGDRFKQLVQPHFFGKASAAQPHHDGRDLGTNFGNPEGEATGRYIDFMRARARGGAGKYELHPSATARKCAK
jgi:hypothetical protein